MELEESEGMILWPVVVILASQQEAAAPLPRPPVDLRGRATPEGVVLTWKPSPEDAGRPWAAVAFEVYRREFRGGSAMKVSTDPVAAPEAGAGGAPRAVAFGDTTAPPEKTVWYSVAGVDLAGRRGPESAPASVFVPDFTANAAPGRIEVVPGRGWMSVWWETTGNPNTLGYKVERSMEEGGVYVPLTAGPVSGPPFADTTGLPGVSYYYRVVSFNRGTEAGHPSLAAQGTFAVARPPAVPANLVAERLPGLVRLRWTEGHAPSLQGYRVEREAGDGRWALLTSFPTIEARFDDRLPPTLTGPLQYRVVAVGLDGKASPPALVRVAP
jgi:hypothetical protein